MKKQLTTLLTVAGLAIGAASAYAIVNYTPGSGVIDSPHNMIKVAGHVDGTNDRVCAFCHTPHHAIPNGDASQYAPLWSHELSTMTFTPYQSPTFNGEYTMDTDPAIGPSRLCMSCHDGVVAIDNHYNFPGVVVRADGDGYNGIDVGRNSDLSNDHPLGFKYSDVAKAPDSGTAPTHVDAEQGIYYGIYPVDKVFGVNMLDVTGYYTTAANLRANIANPAVTTGLNSMMLETGDAATVINPMTGTSGAAKFVVRKIGDLMFKTDQASPDYWMTCASCHDVHNKEVAADSRYMLINSNIGSAVCLTCHNK